MRLSEGHIRPGVVLKVEDKFGIIKASVPGVFSAEDDPSLLPPIYPWFHGCSNTFSKVNEDDNIWVMFFNDNPYELFYFRKDNIKENLANLLDDKYEQVEVIASVESGQGYAQLFFTDGTGWILRNDKSSICIDKDGKIILDYQGSSNRQLSIDDNGISLGTTGGAAEPAVLGDKMKDTLKKLYSVLSSIENAAKVNPYTMAIGQAMSAPLSQYQSSIQKITSQHVTLD